MKTMKTKLMTCVMAMLFCGSTSVFAGAFDFVNKLEAGVGVGFNTNYWNIGAEKIATRTGAIPTFTRNDGLQITDATQTKFRKLVTQQLPGLLAARGVPDADIPTAVTGFVDNLNVAGSDFSGSGDGTAINGVNIDIQANYHVFDWMFFRSGVTIDIAIPVSHTLTGTVAVTSNALGAAVPALDNASYTETVTYEAGGLDIEIPILLGFNLINTEKFRAYFAVGVNLQFGGYEETLSGSRSDTDPILTSITTILRKPIADGDFQSITNTYNPFGVGLHWIVGLKYEMVKGVSLFTEVKWLNASAIIDRTGTEASTTETPATATSVGGGLNGASDTSDNSPISPIAGDAATDSNAVTAINRSYNARWVLGATYTLSL